MQGHEGRLSCQRNFVLLPEVPSARLVVLGSVHRPQSVPNLLFFTWTPRTEWRNGMSVPCKFERSLLSHDEYETIHLTHHPAIYEVEPAELEAIRYIDFLN